MKKLIVMTSRTCAPCRRQKVEIEELLDDVPSFPVQVLDVTEPANAELVSQYGIRSVPTLLVVDAEGREVRRNVGVIPATKLAAFIG